MRKFFTGLKYGTWSTRLYVIAIPVAFLAGAGAIIAAFILNNMLLFLAGVAAVIGSIALIFNYSIEEFVESGEQPIEKSENRKRKKDDTKTGDFQNKGKGTEEPPLMEIAENKTGEELPDESRNESNKNEDLEIRAEELLAYDEKKVKQVFYKYKVKKEHKNIIIDSWEEKGIKQVPAYIWTVRGQLHILVISGAVQEYTMPLSKTGKLIYKRGVICQTKEEYVQFRKESLLSAVFSKYLPVYHSGNKNHRPVIYKNLFAFDNGLTVTNTSVRTIVELLHPQIEIDDIVMRDVRYNDFFKEVYKLGVLLREQVYSIREYQSLVNEVLQNLAESGITKEEYENTLQALYQNKLITEEYIRFYLQYRSQRQGKSPGDTGKRKRKKQ